MIQNQNLLQENANRQHHRVFRRKTNPLDEFPDHEILERFRFTPRGIAYICDLVCMDLERDTKRIQRC
jgi:hypothetical protein